MLLVPLHLIVELLKMLRMERNVDTVLSVQSALQIGDNREPGGGPEHVDRVFDCRHQANELVYAHSFYPSLVLTGPVLTRLWTTR